MKRIITFLALITLFTVTILSCKKGDNDPFFSLLTRNQRLEGNWKIVKEESKQTITNNALGDTSIIINSIYDGTKQITTTTYTAHAVDYSYSVIDTIYYVEEIKFDKDGSYTKTFEMSDLSNSTFTDGNWIFLGKSEANELKNKEAILLTTTKFTQTNGTITSIENYTNTDGDTYVINQLKNTELILTVDKSSRSDDGMHLTELSVKTTYESK